MPFPRPEGFNRGGGYFPTQEEANAAGAIVRAREAEEARVRVMQHGAIVTDVRENGKYITVEWTTTPDPATSLGERVKADFERFLWCKAPAAIEERAFREPAPGTPLNVYQGAVALPRRLGRGKKQPQGSRRAP
jgi:hypothetical protein